MASGLTGSVQMLPWLTARFQASRLYARISVMVGLFGGDFRWIIPRREKMGRKRPLLPTIISSCPPSFAAQAAIGQIPVRQMKKPHYTISTKQLNRPQFKAAAQE
jgi:hypothetical protein